MSVPEDSYTQAQFRQTFVRRHQLHQGKRVGDVTFYGDGTHFFWEDEVGDRHFGVISDLPVATIVRTGSIAATIGINITGVSVTDTFSPALPGALANFRPWANPHIAPSTTFVTCSAFILTSTTIRLSVARATTNTTYTIPAHGDHTVWPSDTQTDVGNGHAHATDSLGLTDYTHSAHGVTLGGAAINAIVDWWISTLRD